MRRLVLLVSLLACGCATDLSGPAITRPVVAGVAGEIVPNALGTPPAYIPRGNLVLIEPFRANQLTIIENGAPVSKYWASLTEEQRKTQMDQTDTVIQIEQRDTSGGITLPAGSVSVNKGLYRVSFTFMRFVNEPCIPSDPSAGYVRTGVGLEASLNIRSNKKNLNVSGLIPLVGAAADNKISGNMQIRTVGITSTSQVLSGYLGNNLQLSPESLGKAMESLAVVRAVLEDDKTTTSPNHMAVTESGPGSCSGKIPATTTISGSSRPITAASGPTN